jgi:hypothetical protein
VFNLRRITLINSIDHLVSQILLALKEESDLPSQLDGLLKPLALKGLSKACQLRSTLDSYICDQHLPQDIRDYAKQKLNELPKF